MIALKRLSPGILGNTAVIGAFSIAAKLAGAAKFIVMARYFGTGDSFDAYLIAFVLPSFIADSIASCITPTLIPILVRIRADRGVGAASRLAQNAATLGIAVMTGLAIPLAITGRWAIMLLGSSFMPGKVNLATSLLLAMLIWLPASALIAVWRAVLNSHHRFAVAAAAPIATPLITMAAVVLWTGSIGIFTLAVGLVSGVAIETAVLGWAVHAEGYTLTPAWDGFTPELRDGINQFCPLAAGATLQTAGPVVDRAVAATLGRGEVAALAYGGKFVSVLLSVVAIPLATAALPVFSRIAAKRDWNGLRRSFFVHEAGTLAVSIPMTGLLIVFSEPLVRAFLQHGAFGASATSVVVHIQQFALLQVPVVIVLALAMRLATALSANTLLIGVAVGAFAANVTGDILLARWIGTAGIPLATATMQVVALVVLLVLLFRREPRLLHGDAVVSLPVPLPQEQPH